MNTIHQIERLDRVDSTSSHLKRNRHRVTSGHLCVAHTQTSGRGRQGHVWHSAPGANLTFSFMLDTTEEKPYDALMVTALTLLDVLASYDIEAAIKMPNDLFVGAKKIAGILIERTQVGSVEHTVVGVGLNVNERLPASMQPLAISMQMLKKTEFELEDVLQAFIDRFNHRVHHPPFPMFHKQVMSQDQTVLLDGQPVEMLGFNEQFVCEAYNGSTHELIPCDRLTFRMKKYKLK